MSRTLSTPLVERALRAADLPMIRHDKTWSRYSTDKPDIAKQLTRVLRTLAHSLPEEAPLAALSLGCSDEPQLRLLAPWCSGGLALVDIEPAALQALDERIRRQRLRQARTIRADFVQELADAAGAQRFRAAHLADRRVNLVTLHHSLYYAPRAMWEPLVNAICTELMARDLPAARGPSSSLHAVLMAPRSDDETSTTWLYNHFVGRFFGHTNDQDLHSLALALHATPALGLSAVRTMRTRVEFFVDDFEKFMGVVWMILLHPGVHRFSPAQQEEVIRFVYDRLYSRRMPLVQEQDHMVVLQ
jgi:hypothetical protein